MCFPRGAKQLQPRINEKRPERGAFGPLNPAVPFNRRITKTLI
jgi:hypothetical protein